MPKIATIKKIMVIGSGPIVIGQAAEFDYAGSQACISLQEEGYEVVLVNSNPATIMTDDEIADHVYLAPLIVASITEIIAKEKPDALLPTLGGQTGLNLAIDLFEAGVLDQYHVQLLGTGLKTIQQAEDREEFKELMESIHQPIPASLTVHDTEAAVKFAHQIGYPVIVRPAFTLGGSGGGIATNQTELLDITHRGLSMSPATECLIEKSIAGYKEIEFEVMRDANGDKISVCCMENFDPVGIHTGDSIVVAPSQSLNDSTYQRLRTASLAIVEALNIQGGCNVQLAQNPTTDEYFVIEVNPRVSRSSALASKATGYPIAKIAAKIAVGLNLKEITNPVTQTTNAAFEPALDYLIVKIPRFPFDKFDTADSHLGTQMKATGEVMGIGLTMEEAFLKAVASLEINPQLENTLLPEQDLSNEELMQHLAHPTDQRLFEIFLALQHGWTIEQLFEATQITPFFLHKLANIWDIMTELQNNQLTVPLLQHALKFGFNPTMIATATTVPVAEINSMMVTNYIQPVYKMVDTCAGEFDSATPYFYSSYFPGENESVPLKNNIIVLGSGPIRIGQGVEFDYTTVHSVQAIQQHGYQAIIINNNPETVSTDFSISDKLYFETLTIDHVMQIIDLEQPEGVIVQFGGQTAINLTAELVARGVNILGTSLAGINQTEDRHEFEELLASLSIKQPNGDTAMNQADAHLVAKQVGYPVMLRPSFVLGGRAMAVVTDDSELDEYVEKAIDAAPHQPILIDHYVAGTECEVDILSDGHDVFIPGIMEHLEGSGVHSGDSISIYPTQHLTAAQKQEIIAISTKIGKAVHCVGMMNIQFIVADAVYVIEVNPRASRTVPFMSKITGNHIAKQATGLILGKSLTEIGLFAGYGAEPDQVFVKAPVFSFAKLPGMMTTLSPEMKSTGESIGSGATFSEALTNALYDSYGSLSNRTGKIVLLDNSAEDDTELLIELAKHNFETMVISGDISDVTPAEAAFVVTGDENQTTDTPLSYFALSNQIPLFSNPMTIAGILKESVIQPV